MVEITAKNGKNDDDPSCTVNYDLPETLKAAGEQFGEEVALSRVNAAVTIDVQAVIRRGLQTDPPRTDEEIQKMVDDFTPGVKRQGKSKSEKADEAFSALSAEEREELFAKFSPDAGAGAGGKGKKGRR